MDIISQVKARKAVGNNGHNFLGKSNTNCWQQWTISQVKATQAVGNNRHNFLGKATQAVGNNGQFLR